MKTPVLALIVSCLCFAFASGIEAQEPQTQMAPMPSAYGTMLTGQSASASTDVFEISASMGLSPGTKALIEACLGESVAIIGNAVLVVHQTILPNGYTVLVVHANPQGAVMLGASSGETYHIAASDAFAQVIAPSGAFVSTFTAKLLVIGQNGPRFGGPILLHLTVTPTGDITADIEMLDKGFQCLP